MRTIVRASAAVVTALLLLVVAPTTASAETVEDPAVDVSAPGVADGALAVTLAVGVDPTAPDLAASIDAMERAIAAPDGPGTTDEPIGTTGATVVFDAQYPAPSEVQGVVMAGVNAWAAELDLTGGPVEIEVAWYPFGSPDVLAAAGFLRAFQGPPVIPTDSLTPGPLANVLFGRDLTPDEPEIRVILNSDYPAWFVDTTGTPPADQVDLYTVVLHELGHGFGFIGSPFGDDGSEPTFSEPPFGYDTHVYHGDERLLDTADPSSLLTSGNLFFDLPDGSRHKLYAPAAWIQGRSFSTFDEDTYQGTDPGALMTPFIEAGEVQRTLDDAVLGVMEQVGWTLTGTPPPPPPPPPPAPGTIGGAVTSVDGGPVEGLVVDLFAAVDPYNRGEWFGGARTDAAGGYAFGDVEAGCYVVTFTAPAGGAFPDSGGPYLQRYLCLEAGESNTGVDAVVNPGGSTPASIGGTVTNDGAAFGGLVVDLFAANGDGSRATWLGDQATGDAGTYAFAPVEPGCYVLVFIAPDGFEMVGGNRWLERQICVGAGAEGTVDAAVTAGP